uniref:protein-tyrosine-phosphatase n=1 Tax=Denticeps clupeoides TaxID=299321 RepID=A0AAY4C892_9TELE
MHPELGCLISCAQLQEFSIILLYDSPSLQRCFLQLSELGMDPVILMGGYSAFHSLYPFLCPPRIILLDSERHSLTIYPSEILDGALFQGSAAQARNCRIIQNLHITHVVNATAEFQDAFPSDLSEALPAASRFIGRALRGGCLGSSVLMLAFLMEHRCWSLLHAFRWLKERRGCAAPNAGFLWQLSDYEEQLFGQQLTSLDDIHL